LEDSKKRARQAPKKKKREFKWDEVLTYLRSHPTCSVPMAGFVFGLSESGAYDSANANGSIGGVPVILAGGKKKRCPSIAVLRKVGLADPPPQAAA